MSEVTSIGKARQHVNIGLTRDTAPLFLELVSKAAVAGPQAHLLADLYAQALAAVKMIEADET